MKGQVLCLKLGGEQEEILFMKLEESHFSHFACQNKTQCTFSPMERNYTAEIMCKLLKLPLLCL